MLCLLVARNLVAVIIGSCYWTPAATWRQYCPQVQGPLKKLLKNFIVYLSEGFSTFIKRCTPFNKITKLCTLFYPFLGRQACRSGRRVACRAPPVRFRVSLTTGWESLIYWIICFYIFWLFLTINHCLVVLKLLSWPLNPDLRNLSKKIVCGYLF